LKKNSGFHKQEKRKKELKRLKKQEEKRAKRLNKGRGDEDASLGLEEELHDSQDDVVDNP